MMKRTWLCLGLFTVAGCLENTAPGNGRFVPVEESARYGVVNGDANFQSSSISLLDANGQMLADDWYDSGTFTPQNVATLSGDVVLPTRGPGEGRIAIIDRQGTNVVTLIDIANAQVLGQIAVDGDAPSGQPKINSNPYDISFFEDGRAWITRFNINPAGTFANRGSDILEVDLDRFIVTRYFELRMFESVVGDVPTYARPAQSVRAGDFTVVGLMRASSDLAALDSAATEGALAIMHSTFGTVEELHLAGLKNCVDVFPIPGSDAKVLVSCWGYPFGPTQRESAGLLVLDLSQEGEDRIEKECLFGEYTALPYMATPVIPISDSKVAAVENDDVNFIDSKLHLLSLSAEDCVDDGVIATSGAFAFNYGAYDANLHLLLIPDSSLNGGSIRRFDLSLTPGNQELSAVRSGAFTGFSPKLLRRLD